MTWIFEKGELSLNSKIDFLRPGSRSNILTIHKVQLKNSGKYECLGFDNKSNPVQGKAVLVVIGKKIL